MDDETIRRFSEDYPEDRETLSSVRRRALLALNALHVPDAGLRGPTAKTGPADRARRVDAIRHAATLCRLLNYRRQVADGTMPAPRGEYWGDGIARTVDGTSYEPLEPYPQQYKGPDMSGLQIRHVPTYDRLGVTLTQPELLKADADMDGIAIGIGADPLTRREFVLTEGEALRLAEWLNGRLEGGAYREKH